MTPRYLLLIGCLLALVACEDPSLPSSVVVDTAQAHPATPAAPAMATPKPAPSPLMATPRPSVVAVPTPPPASPSPTASLDPAASPVATPTPDRYKKTTVATDLAVSGPGFFVLATKPNPASAADLLFTRNGHFKLVHDTAGALSLWRLRHATFDFYAAGYMIAGGTGAGAPSETSASDHAELATSWGGLDTTLGGVVIDAERNTDALTTARFDFTGRLLLGELAPRGADGGPVQVYVGVAQVAEPSQLVAQPGFAGVYKYVPAAGALQLGVATSGDGRPVGNANLILTSTLEQENGSSTAKP